MYPEGVNSLSPRLAALLIALGISLFAFGGTSLAASQGVLERSGSDSPGQSDNPSNDDNGVEGEFGSGGGENPTGDTSPTATPGQGAALPSADTAATKGSTSQAAALPFTGYLAIPVLLTAIVMLGTGFLLRRRSV